MYILFLCLCLYFYYLLNKYRREITTLQILTKIKPYLPKKTLIIGQSGCGKSTLSSNLYKYIDNSELLHLDEYIFGPEWSYVPNDEFYDNVNSIINLHQNKHIIIEGVMFYKYYDACRKLLQNMIDNNKIDNIIILKEHLCVRFFRIFKRSLFRFLGIEKQGAGGKEKLTNICEMFKIQYNNNKIYQDNLNNFEISLNCKYKKINIGSVSAYFL